MGTVNTVPADVLRALAGFDSCTVSNAIEQFDVRTRNEGYMRGGIQCVFPGKPPVIGYAVTASIRTSSTPVTGHIYFDRADWWTYLQSIPAPRFIVVQDVDHAPGYGALFGEVHARIAVALSTVAYATNGAVRDLPGVRASGLQMYAGNIAVSHAYAHIVQFGEKVQVGGLDVNPGDLLHGDEHGVVSVPQDIASEVPAVCRRIREREKELIDFCMSREFSPEKLQEHIRRAARMHYRGNREANK